MSLAEAPDHIAGTSEVPAAAPAFQQDRLASQLGLYVLVLILGAGFGLQYASARMMGLAGVEPIGALWLIHVALSGLFVALLAAGGGLFRPTRRDLGFFLVTAAFTNLGQLGVELIAAHHVPAGELTLIVSLLPVFVLTIAVAFRSEVVSMRRAGGIILGVAASSAILLPSAMGAGTDLFWVGVTFLAPVSQALGMVAMARFWPARLSPLQVATGNLVMGTVLLSVVVPASGDTMSLHDSFGGNVATALFALTMAVEFYVFAILLKRGGATLASCADFIAVCAGLLFGYLLFGEVPTFWMLAAAGLCLLALKFATDRQDA